MEFGKPHMDIKHWRVLMTGMMCFFYFSGKILMLCEWTEGVYHGWNQQEQYGGNDVNPSKRPWWFGTELV